MIPTAKTIRLPHLFLTTNLDIENCSKIATVSSALQFVGVLCRRRRQFIVVWHVEQCFVSVLVMGRGSSIRLLATEKHKISHSWAATILDESK